MIDYLRRAELPFLVIEDRAKALKRLRADGVEVIAANAADPEAIAAANMAGARRLFVAIDNAFEAGQAVEQARAANPSLEIIARAFSSDEIDHLKLHGADRIVVDVNRGLPDPVGFIERIVEATGPDRVCCAVHARRVIDDKGTAFELVSPALEASGINAVSLVERLTAIGACEVLLVPVKGGPEQGRALHDGELIELCASTLSLPLLAHADDVEAADIATALLMGADGIVTRLFSGGRPGFDEVKRALAEFGLPIRA